MDKKSSQLKPSLIEPLRYVWPIMLLLICAIAGMIAFPKVDPNSPDMLYITLAFFGFVIEGQKIGGGMTKRAK